MFIKIYYSSKLTLVSLIQNTTQIDKQNAEIEDIAKYKKMKEMQISGWRQEAIDKKYALIKMARASRMRVKTTEKSLKNIVAIRQKEKANLQVSFATGSCCYWILM